jgi:hypothetical protein
MGATTPVAFDPKPRKLGDVRTFYATSAILSGQIVGYDDTGVSNTVSPHTSSLSAPVGVALHSQATVGGPVAVACNGSIVKVMLDATDSAATPGDWIGSGAVAGCGLKFDSALATHAAIMLTGIWPIGVALEDVVAGSGTDGGTVFILVNVTPVWSRSS